MVEDPTPLFAFVWQPKEISPSVLDVARRTTTRAVFDLTRSDLPGMARLLASEKVKDLKITCTQCMGPDLQDVLETTSVETLWVEFHPVLLDGPSESFMAWIEKTGRKWNCIPILADLETFERLMSLEHGPPCVALKGAEASGVVSAESIGILYARARQTLARYRRRMDLVIWGGITTPEAASAFLSTGASGVVFESLHWLTDLVKMDPELRQRISGLRYDHTTFIATDWGVGLRVLDKGNSQAVRSFRTWATSLGAHETTGEKRHALAERLKRGLIPALESRFLRDELIAIGVEATFAGAFAGCFGSETSRAIEGFLAEVGRLMRDAPRFRDHYVKSPVARELGTTYPFLQGAMSWITDRPAFALSVAKAGGLPTFALGPRNRRQLEEDFGDLGTAMGRYPFAVNVVALPENPYREDQLKWVESLQPPFAVIAGAEPAWAARLREKGIEVFYIAPDESLMRLALASGIRYLILEGNEAGGHVGAHSTLTLAQIALYLKKTQPHLWEGRRVVLAGGIFDRETALRAAMLGADAIQMGTAYLLTDEIVSTGALSRLYQHVILTAKPGQTVLSGASAGFYVRSVRTPKIEVIKDLEREFLAGSMDEPVFRMRLEELAADSLSMAARRRRHPGGPLLDEETCLQEGQFMSGAVAGSIRKVRGIEELHQELAMGEVHLTTPDCQQGPYRPPRRAVRAKEPKERVAITGMAWVNALGSSLQGVFESSLAMQNGIVEVPPSKWDHGLYYDPDPRRSGKTYCRVGAFHPLSIDRKALGIAPHDFLTMADSTRLTLWLAHSVLEDAGDITSTLPKDRIGVLVSQNSGEAASTLPHIIVRTTLPDVLRVLIKEGLLNPEMKGSAEQHLLSGLLPVDDTTLLGRLNSAAAGFICRKYGFLGPSLAVSAACATSLAAVYVAVQLIRNHILDAAVVGGGEESLNPAHYLEFAALGALAGLSGRGYSPKESSRPFDLGRDGMVLGEGGGMVVLERESVARARGARIYAFITGVGASNSDKGMVESLADTQQLAIRAAFKDTGYGPDCVGLVECHATGTVQGDREEVNALKRWFAQGTPTVLAAFKSQIGHNLGAAGISSLIRGVMAMRQGVYPGTSNYRVPDPDMGLEPWGFRVLKEPGEWPSPGGDPRRAQVNAFGFGGANYVVQLEECREDGQGVLVCPPEARKDVADSPDSLGRLRRERIGKACEPTEGLAMVFPGQGSQYPGMGKALYESFAPIRHWMDRFARIADFDVLNLLFEGDSSTLEKTRWQQPALFILEYAMGQYLLGLGVSPIAMAGHSLGEFTALGTAGAFSWEEGLRIVTTRARLMEKAARAMEDPGRMMAIDASPEAIHGLIQGRDGVVFTHYNSSRQVVVGGSHKAVSGLQTLLQGQGYRCTPLKVSMAFHTLYMDRVRGEFEDVLASVPIKPTRVPVISNTTGHPFPGDPDAIRGLLAQQLVTPVQWKRTVETLWRGLGANCFVEVGPGAVINNLIMDTVEGARCIPTCQEGREVPTFQGAIDKLYFLGHLKVHRIVLTSPQPERGLAAQDLSKPLPEASRPHPDPSDGENVLERIIGIIMEATGYERAEIGPEMDLREDLSIRSSRFPLIMDMAERAFNISIRLEDFVGVRTVRQVAERVADLAGRGPQVDLQTPFGRNTPSLRSLRDLRTPIPGEERDLSHKPVLRLVVGETKRSYPGGGAPLIPPHQDVGILYIGTRSTLVQETVHVMQQEHQAHVVEGTLDEEGGAWQHGGGIIIVLQGPEHSTLGNAREVARVLTRAFIRVKDLVRSGHALFCMAIQRNVGRDTWLEGLAEGIRGIFLAASLEYGSILFRSMDLDENTDLKGAVACALDRQIDSLHLSMRSEGLFVEQLQVQPSPCEGRHKGILKAGDVLVISGGGRGVTSSLARALGPFRPRMVLLGRSHVQLVEKVIQDLQEAGIEVEYRTCDVRDADRVSEVLSAVAERYGRIDGIIHGAGTVHDAFMEFMTPEDFADVVEVKLLGAWNLYEAARSHGLRFMVALSSIAAVFGNLGQCNYCAANRGMDALMRIIGSDPQLSLVKSIMLPPIEGVGIADHPEIKQLLISKGLGDAYVHIEEMTELLCREILSAVTARHPVLYARALPQIKTLEVDRDGFMAPPAPLSAGGLAFEREEVPMIYRITRLDLGEGVLEAERAFSLDVDLWLADHRPYTAMRRPVLSGVMIVEIFLEAAQLLYPYLRVQGCRKVRYMETLECPPDRPVPLRILCRKVDAVAAETLCEVSLLHLKPSTLSGESWSVAQMGQVLLTATESPLPLAPLFVLKEEDLQPRDISFDQIQALYERHTALRGRYRVIEGIDQMGPAEIRGKTVYREIEDFAGLKGTRYLYPPYLLEALGHLVGFHGKIHRGERRGALPMGFEAMTYTRPCCHGEPLRIEAVLKAEDEEGQIWDAHALDKGGDTIMQVRGLQMRWLLALGEECG